MKKERAMRYKRAYDVFEEIGAGPDENYDVVMQICNGIKYLCRTETGYEIIGYNKPLEKIKRV